MRPIKVHDTDAHMRKLNIERVVAKFNTFLSVVQRNLQNYLEIPERFLLMDQAAKRLEKRSDRVHSLQSKLSSELPGGVPESRCVGRVDEANLHAERYQFLHQNLPDAMRAETRAAEEYELELCDFSSFLRKILGEGEAAPNKSLQGTIDPSPILRPQIGRRLKRP
jgi:hypothetical protein